MRMETLLMYHGKTPLHFELFKNHLWTFSNYYFTAQAGGYADGNTGKTVLPTMTMRELEESVGLTVVHDKFGTELYRQGWGA